MSKADASRGGRSLHTRLIHPGNGVEDGHTGVSPLLDRSSTFRLDGQAEEALATRNGHDRFDVYGRFGTRTTREAGRLVAELEGAEEGVLFASGMGAIASTLLALARPGEVLAVASDVYGGTEGLLAQELVPRGLELVRFDAAAPETLRACTRALHDAGKKLSAVLCESISNPLLKVADIDGLAEVAHAAGAKLCVDATFAAGIAQRPLERGADVVMHSATKFLNGHSDVIAGAAAGDAETMRAVFSSMAYVGACIDPAGAWLLARGMRTLPLRFARQCATALDLAQRLEAHPSVNRVYYPGLASHATHALAQSQLSKGGAVLSFEVAGAEAALRVSRALKLCAFAVSLGGVETLIAIPRRSSHVGFTAEHWESIGISDGLVRVAVGLEDPIDLWADVAQALEQA